jgi:hypothetical protein
VTAPKLARSTASGRVYEHPLTGERVPSVTTIISGGVPKPALPRWAAKSAAEYAAKSWDTLAPLDADERVTLIKGAPWRESGRAADLGSLIHDAIDCWLSDAPLPDWPADAEGFMAGFTDFLSEREPHVVHTEGTIWNREHGYAGTFDLLAVINGRLTLIDHKTGKGVYPEVALQLSALAHGEVIVAPDGSEQPMPAVDLFGVLHLRPRSWALVPVTPTGVSFDAFLAAKQITEWTRDVAPGVLGARLGGAA